MYAIIFAELYLVKFHQKTITINMSNLSISVLENTSGN